MTKSAKWRNTYKDLGMTKPVKLSHVGNAAPRIDNRIKVTVEVEQNSPYIKAITKDIIMSG